MKNNKRTPKGQFKNGTSGNPSGRPAGSRNKATLLYEQLLEGGAEELIKKAMEMAKNGDVRALALCLDRILPVKRERCINLQLRPLEGPQDLPICYRDITTAIAEGQITPGEGESLSKIVATQSQLMDSVDVDRRLGLLESHLGKFDRYRSEVAAFKEAVAKHAPEDEDPDDEEGPDQ